MLVKDLLTSPARWLQHVPARTTAGEKCRGTHPDACAWCLGEAILRCYPDPYDRVAVTKRVMAHLGLTFGDRRFSLTDWNDVFTRTFADVQALVLATGI